MTEDNPSLSPSLSDFPKLHCPFIRQTFCVNHDQWKIHGSRLSLKRPEVYLVIDQINPGYEWVFSDKDTIAVEKLNGTNVKIKTLQGRLVAVQNRLNVIDPLQILKGKTFIIEGVFQAIGKDFIEENGEQAGELVGPKLQGNPYRLDVHLWYPFELATRNLTYRSFHEHERNFLNWSSWFKDHLVSRFHTKLAAKSGSTDRVMAEGVVFYNPRRRSEGKTYMAKLRRDMFDWYYSGHIEITDYQPSGTGKMENQNEFD